MDIGRKIYYEISTGMVILDTGERAGNVIPTTKGHDFSVYPQLICKDIDNYDCLELSYGVRGNEFINYGSLKVNPDTKELTIYPRLTITTDKVQIVSDGVDTATISSDHAETFCIDDGEDYAVNPIQFASNVPGVHTITAKSTLYGMASINVEVV